MNIFKFLDDTVKGTTLFFFNFWHSTARLALSPLAGSFWLYRTSRDEKANQISSISYLTMTTGLAAAFLTESLAEAPGALFTQVLQGAADLAAKGAIAQGLVPFIFGALAGAILISSMLRLAARVRGLGRARRVRFVATMEYQLGLAMFGLAVVGLAMELTLYSSEAVQLAAVSVCGGLSGAAIAFAAVVAAVALADRRRAALLRALRPARIRWRDLNDANRREERRRAVARWVGADLRQQPVRFVLRLLLATVIYAIALASCYGAVVAGWLFAGWVAETLRDAAVQAVAGA